VPQPANTNDLRVAIDCRGAATSALFSANILLERAVEVYETYLQAHASCLGIHVHDELRESDMDMHDSLARPTCMACRNPYPH
jgi:hypothetical protein